jgi:hypothetical protein
MDEGTGSDLRHAATVVAGDRVAPRTIAGASRIWLVSA